MGPEYRPNWSVGAPDPERMSGAPLATDSGDWLLPGGSTTVRLFPMFPEFWTDVRPGTKLFAFEGGRLVGIASVTEIIPPS